MVPGSELMNARGFTLVEVMMVMVLIGIAAALAYPAYTSHVVNARRGDAHALMLAAAVKQEQFYAQRGGYTADMRELGYPADPAVSSKGFYQVDVTLSGGGQGYTLTATRTGVQTNDALCGDLTLTHTGIRSAVNNSDATPQTTCW